MTTPIRAENSLDRAAGIHDMLLRLAGRLPDDLLTGARTLLAEWALDDLARMLVATAAAEQMSLHPRDIELLAGLLSQAGGDTGPATTLTRLEYDPLPPFVFQPVTPEQADAIRQRGATVPAALDLTTQVPPSVDPVDLAAIDTVAAHDGVLGLWRTWRSPADGASWPPPRRIYLVEVVDPADRPQLAHDLQRSLTAAGEMAPQVEVSALGETPPYYQRAARGSGALLWAHQPAPVIEHASVFDIVDPVRGAMFAPEHPKVTDPAIRDALLRYLDSGFPLMHTTATIHDVVDTSRGAVVPLNFRTDGIWIWSDVVSYYLREHHLRPDDELVAHAEQHGWVMPQLDGVAIFRALAKLQEPPEDEPVWRFQDEPAGAGHVRGPGDDN
ncbi:hypothetical protein [Micromonospora echinofusca]|uniref:Uncharacterized protein n=1 Tax=Micromonospora echinofusca TaxID=47858 RepID=A0ABS3VX88_MICEH|nr:hypothetical protein [Micromonospora echinofusca]MBO4209038.1 hypothetical protein [Micromonospora echinofusca]